MEYIKAIVIGAGSRGQFAYGKYAIKNPDEIKFIAIAEPNKIRRESFVVEYGIKSQNIFNDWRDLLNRDKFADVVFICTPDKMHFDIAMIALEKGYDLLLEKPIAPTYQECQIIADKAKEMGASVAVAHVLRYTPFFSIIKEIIDSKKFGNIRGINYIESVGHIHYSHSFVRGNWRNENISAPMILAKSCHDMDMLLYLIGSDCSNISSYGSKGFFSSKNKPAGTPHRCLDGCPIKDECPYYAPNIYIDGNPTWVAHLGLNSTNENDILESLKTSPYGICVYDCDNNMCEQQDVILKFKNNVTASFIMSAFTQEITRTVKIMMEKGEIIGDLHSNKVDVYNFLTGKKSTIHNVSSNTRGHGGGDEGLMKEFLTHLKDKEKYPLKTSIEEAVQSHKMALLAHKAMVDNIAIELD
jgi:predicted dehydrogenase